MRKIGLFGGSFDPPTNAHLEIAENLISDKILDEIEFVPAYVSYHGKKYQASPSERIDMLDILIDGSLYNRQLSVNPFEIIHKMKSSTYDFIDNFLRTVKTYGEEVQYYFVVGGDNAKNISNFINGENLIKKIPFVVFSRENDKLKTKGDWYNEDPHIIFNMKNVEHIKGCSSTYIRDCVSVMDDSGIPKEFFQWCDKWVFSYILNNGLYSEANNGNIKA